ncbi:MAG: hypothetical protein F4X44_12850 [Gammaproteobacteria bacterium]|nr:hypothetical protein [Gammaproteobacteria bacterium]MYD81485.1 hypothetical protein [Gammaproteobacteria bacterium]
MRASLKLERKFLGLVSLAIFSGFFTFSVSFAEVEEQTEEISSTSGENFTRLDTAEAIQAYRDERHAKVTERLAESRLSHEHSEILANAIASMYLGVPLSSYSHFEREESSQEESTESNNQWVINEDGKIRHVRESITYSLNSRSPWIFLPPVPFEAETGRVLDDSISEATFVFDMNMTMDAEGDESFFGMKDKMKFVAEVTVNKLDQSPKILVLKLAKPLRKRFFFKIETIRMELHFSYIEACEGFAVTNLVGEVDGSAIFVGKLHELEESTFTDIDCQQPLVRLLPDESDSNFFQF